MKKIIAVIIFLFTFSFLQLESSFAQKELKLANYHFENFEFSKAIPLYLDALYIDTTLEAVEKLAFCYKKTHQYQEALNWYNRALEIPYFSSSSVLYYAEMLKYHARYNEAIEQFEFYKLYAPEKKEELEKEIKSCEYAKQIEPLKNIKVSNVKELNTKYSESGVTMFNNQLIFSSNRKYGSNQIIDNWTNNYYYKIYASSFSIEKSIIKYQRPKLFENTNINKGYHNAFPAFDILNNQIYFNRTEFEKNPNKAYQVKTKEFSNRVQVFKSNSSNGKRWSIPVPLDFNKPQSYSILHPTVSPDSKFLIFASDMPGGYGGYDLYISEILSYDSVSTPVNMGNIINSKGDELFPCFNSFGDLYFSSNGHLGMGGLDLYVSQYRNYEFGEINHLYPPFNSAQDDFSIYFLNNKNTGFFCSNRFGGLGEDDIYYFEIISNK